MDQFSLRRDDTADVKLVETNRDYWNKRATKKTVDIVDELLEILNANLDSPQQLNYNKYYIGLNDGSKSRNFVYFKPKNNSLIFTLNLKTKKAGLRSWMSLGFQQHQARRIYKSLFHLSKFLRILKFLQN